MPDEGFRHSAPRLAVRAWKSVCDLCRGAPWGAQGQGKPSPYKTRLVAALPRCATRSTKAGRRKLP
jgi:hypothetical protein